MAQRLVLHFDINGTITAVDSTEVGNDYENTNMTIARCSYGKIVSDKWILNENYKNSKDSISYYDYLKRCGEDYKKKSFIFCEEGQPGSSLKYLCDKVYPSIKKTFIFPSFIRVIERFPNACIVLRSFGKDISEILSILKKEYNFDIQTGNIIHDDNGMSLVFPKTNDQNGSIYINQNINNLYVNNTTHIAIQEDYKHWNNHKRNSTYGKTIYSDNNLLQIFFDDNECVNIIGNKNCYYFKVNTLGALENDDYFIEIIKEFV